MNKIVAISLVADCADIIESFVRHTLTYADELLIVEHKVTDTTGEILQALLKEGLPITVERYDAAELCHEEILTSLMHRAIEEYGADIVVPVDADEFILTDDSAKPCRAVFLHLRTDMTFYAWHWLYELEKPEQERSAFLLDRPLRRKKQHEPIQKAIIGKEAAKLYPFLAQGTHYLYRIEAGKRIAAPALEISFLHFAHFQWRGSLHTAVKVLNGWIGNAAKYSLHTARCYYWKEHFDTVFAGAVPPVALLPEESEKVQNLVQKKPSITLHYTKDAIFSPLKSLMRLSEQLAQDFAQERVCARQKLVSIILVHFGDTALWQRSLECIAAQTYPYLEIIVLDFTESKAQLLEDLAPLKKAHRVVFAAPLSLEMQLSKAVKGEYIQWLLPGDLLFAEKIMQMVTTLELDDELSFVIADAQEDPEDADKRDFFYPLRQARCVVGAGAWHGDFVLSKGRSPLGGLSGAIFRRFVMEACAWFASAFFRSRFFPLAAFMLLFQKNANFRMGIFEIPLLSREATDIGEILWHPAEWAAILLSCGDARQKEQVRAALTARAEKIFAREDLLCRQDFSCARRVFEEILSALY